MSNSKEKPTQEEIDIAMYTLRQRADFLLEIQAAEACCIESLMSKSVDDANRKRVGEILNDLQRRQEATQTIGQRV
jgi:hypothetical protein